MMKNESVLLDKSVRQEGQKTLYTIAEVAGMLNVHQQTLRNWERKRVVIPLRAGARRIYTQEHIELCKRVKEYSGKGVSLKGIKELLDKMQGGNK